MSVDLRLVEKGRGQPRDALAQEAKVHASLAAQYEGELKKNGWSDVDTAAFVSNVALLEGSVGTQAEAWCGATSATTAESQAIDNAKSFVRRLRNALPRVLREAPDAGVTLKSFEAGDRIGRSTPKISKYLSKLRPSVARIEGNLKPHFDGQEATALLDQVKAALDTADTTQELARRNAPDQTLALYEHMGRVLEGIEDMNRAGRSAFDGDAAIAAKFNKDVLLRGRKAAKKTAESGEADEGGANGAEDAQPDAPAPPVPPV